MHAFEGLILEDILEVISATRTAVSILIKILYART